MNSPNILSHLIITILTFWSLFQSTSSDLKFISSNNMTNSNSHVPYTDKVS